jgi:hypothetical protein
MATVDWSEAPMAETQDCFPEISVEVIKALLDSRAAHQFQRAALSFLNEDVPHKLVLASGEAAYRENRLSGAEYDSDRLRRAHAAFENIGSLRRRSCCWPSE